MRSACSTGMSGRSSLATIAAAVQPGVVSISTGSAEGSGVVVRGDGYVLTNNHVVSTAQGRGITLTFADGKVVTASIVGTDPTTDLANCGGCGMSCMPANVATAVCAASSCGFDKCTPGFGNCDMNQANGCEANTGSDPNRCGGPCKSCRRPVRK